MYKKMICKMYYGEPVAWMDKIIPHYNTLEKWGWHFTIFTDMPMKSKGNVEIVKSDVKWFSNFVSKRFKINYDLHFTPEANYPLSKHLYDLWPTQGVLFKDYHNGYDFWGHGCLDIKFGDLGKWLPDSLLKTLDIFGNDPGAICGPFSLYRNIPKVNNLFKEIPDWKKKLEGFSDIPMDEHDMTLVVRKARDEKRIRFESAFWQGKDSLMVHFNKEKQWPID